MYQVASQFVCPEETAELFDLPVPQREHAFFLCWTRKEAYIKAVADGLYIPLNSFRVTLNPNDAATFVHLGHNTNAARAWRLEDLRLEAGYAAALASEGAPRLISVHPTLDPARLLRLFWRNACVDGEFR